MIQSMSIWFDDKCWRNKQIQSLVMYLHNIKLAGFGPTAENLHLKKCTNGEGYNPYETPDWT